MSCRLCASIEPFWKYVPNKLDLGIVALVPYLVIHGLPSVQAHDLY